MRTKNRTRLAKKSFVAVLSIVVVPCAALLSESAVAGAAVSYPYQVIAPGGALHERSAPSTSAPLIGSLPNAAGINIVCQTLGSSVNGSSVWDQLDNSSYVSDYYTSTPNVGTWSPPIPQCSSSPAPAPAAQSLQVPGQPGTPLSGPTSIGQGLQNLSIPPGTPVTTYQGTPPSSGFTLCTDLFEDNCQPFIDPADGSSSGADANAVTQDAPDAASAAEEGTSAYTNASGTFWGDVVQFLSDLPI